MSLPPPTKPNKQPKEYDIADYKWRRLLLALKRDVEAAASEVTNAVQDEDSDIWQNWFTKYFESSLASYWTPKQQSNENFAK